MSRLRKQVTTKDQFATPRGNDTLRRSRITEGRCMRPVGRPTKYTPELLAAAHAYAEGGWVEAGEAVPSIFSLALAIGIRRSTKQDGTGKTGHPDRRCGLPDLRRRTGAGFQGTGTSGGSRPIPGMGAGPEHVPSREGFFAAGHAGPPDVFCTAGIPRIPARPLRRFPRAFREGISFRAQGPFRFR